MTVLNYSTHIPVERSVVDIQRHLAHQGVESIHTHYEDGQAAGLAFVIQTEFGPRTYRLPANVAGVLAALRREKQTGRLPSLPTSQVTREHAARVAWRILKDWIEVQLALLQSGSAPLDQIMMPYMIAGEDGRTMYELYRARQLALPADSPRLDDVGTR